MSPADLVARAEGLGVTFAVEDDQVVLTLGGVALPEDLIAALRGDKAGVRQFNGERAAEAHYRTLCSFLGKSVVTPDGTGELLQVFRERAGVELVGLKGRMTFYHPSKVRVK